MCRENVSYINKFHFAVLFAVPEHSAVFICMVTCFRVAAMAANQFVAQSRVVQSRIAQGRIAQNRSSRVK